MAAEGEERNLVVNAISSLLEGNGLGGPVPGDVNYGGVNYDLLGTLSAPEKRRLCALKKLQEASIVVETEFYKRIHEIEKEFEPKFAEFFEKRRTVISGEYEPTDEEADYPIVQGITDEEKEKLDEKEQPASGDSKGIRNFWLNVLKGTEAVTDLIQENDEPVLKHLTDITSSIELDPPGFTLYFHFSDNEFFANSILVKKYLLDMELDKADPYEFDGPTVAKAIGDTINWKEGKNITQKVIKKKQKKDGSSNKFVTKVVRADSFFNFFTPPEIPEKDEMNEDQEDEYVEAHDSLRADYEIGQILRDQVVPRAVLFFTGEVTNEDSFDDGFEGSSADGDDGEGSSDGDE